MQTKLLRLVLGMGLAVAAFAANAQVYTFTQTGFDEGAFISGSFEATDTDGSGQIVAGSLYNSFDEITAFSISFSGNSKVAAFSHDLSQLTALVYNVGSGFLGDDITPSQEAIGSNFYGDFDYYSGMGFGGYGGAVTDNGTGIISYSYDLVQVNAVPVPGAVWLFGSALAGVIGLRRKTRV